LPCASARTEYASSSVVPITFATNHRDPGHRALLAHNHEVARSRPAPISPATSRPSVGARRSDNSVPQETPHTVIRPVAESSPQRPCPK
jgi:hypothetical protein